MFTFSLVLRLLFDSSSTATLPDSFAFARCNNSGDEKYQFKVDKPGAGFRNVHTESLILCGFSPGSGLFIQRYSDGRAKHHSESRFFALVAFDHSP